MNERALSTQDMDGSVMFWLFALQTSAASCLSCLRASDLLAFPQGELEGLEGQARPEC